MKDILIEFLTLQANLKIFHWQTESYAEHKAFEKTYKKMDELIDDFIECYQGKYDRIYLEGSDYLEIKDYDKEDLISFLSYYQEVIKSKITSFLSEEDSDLLNIKDEMLATINKLAYLLTLN